MCVNTATSLPSAAIASDARTREDLHLSFQERALSISLTSMDPAEEVPWLMTKSSS